MSDKVKTDASLTDGELSQIQNLAGRLAISQFRLARELQLMAVDPDVDWLATKKVLDRVSGKVLDTMNALELMVNDHREVLTRAAVNATGPHVMQIPAMPNCPSRSSHIAAAIDAGFWLLKLITIGHAKQDIGELVTLLKTEKLTGADRLLTGIEAEAAWLRDQIGGKLGVATGEKAAIKKPHGQNPGQKPGRPKRGADARDADYELVTSLADSRLSHPEFAREHSIDERDLEKAINRVKKEFGRAKDDGDAIAQESLNYKEFAKRMQERRYDQ
jgi:hypothetical protein